MSEQDELTALQQAERGALCGDSHDALRVVGGLREYRELVERLLAASDPALILKCEVEAEVARIESGGVD